MKSAVCFLGLSLIIASCANNTSPSQALNLECEPYENADQVLQFAPDHLIIFGEMHGTVESVEGFQQFVCSTLERGFPVRLGLETGHAQSVALDSALATPFDDTRVRDAAPQFWSTPDGKGTEAALKFLKQVSAWRAAGFDVSVFTYDSEPADFRGAKDIARMRDATMAREIDRQLEDFNGAVLVLTGGFHARTKQFEFAGQQFFPMASEITGRPVLSLSMKYGPGEAWVNATVQNEDGSIESSIGPLKVSGNVGDDTSLRVFDLEVQAEELYDGYYFTGPITPSPPAFPELLEDAE